MWTAKRFTNSVRSKPGRKWPTGGHFNDDRFKVADTKGPIVSNIGSIALSIDHFESRLVIFDHTRTLITRQKVTPF